MGQHCLWEDASALFSETFLVTPSTGQPRGGSHQRSKWSLVQSNPSSEGATPLTRHRAHCDNLERPPPQIQTLSEGQAVKTSICDFCRECPMWRSNSIQELKPHLSGSNLNVLSLASDGYIKKNLSLQHFKCRCP